MKNELSVDVLEKPASIDISTKNGEKMFSFEELREVWYFSMIHGATAWQYLVDNKKDMPTDFMKGLDAIREKVVSPIELQEVLKSRGLMVGLFHEAVNKEPDISVPTEETKTTKQD